MRAGIGSAAHGFDPGRVLMLGGVKVPGVWGLRGPGDGDVLLRATADALLGAAGLGDLGDHAREDEPDAPSAALVAECVVKLAARGRRVLHVDALLHTDRAEIRAERRAMAARLATLLGVAEEAVNVKTAPAEGGALGTDGVGALVVVTVGEDA